MSHRSDVSELSDVQLVITVSALAQRKIASVSTQTGVTTILAKKLAKELGKRPIDTGEEHVAHAFWALAEFGIAVNESMALERRLLFAVPRLSGLALGEILRGAAARGDTPLALIKAAERRLYAKVGFDFTPGCIKWILRQCGLIFGDAVALTTFWPSSALVFSALLRLGRGRGSLAVFIERGLHAQLPELQTWELIHLLSAAASQGAASGGGLPLPFLHALQARVLENVPQLGTQRIVETLGAVAELIGTGRLPRREELHCHYARSSSSRWQQLALVTMVLVIVAL